MVGIIFTFIAVVLGLCLVFVFRDGGTASRKSSDNQVHVPLAGLSGASLPPFDIIVGKEDYDKLVKIPELKPVSEMFWRERRRVVLKWLGELQKDVHILWRFRRFLVRNGLLVTFREEVGIVFTGLLALVYLKVIRAAVFIFGPFALHGALENARLLVERLSIWGERAFARVPAARKAEIEQGWTQQLVAMGMRAG